MDGNSRQITSSTQKYFIIYDLLTKWHRDFLKNLIQVEIFWVVVRCSVVVGYQRFGGPCCLHLHFALMMEEAWSSETTVS
jgi:hypothetical protein